MIEKRVYINNGGMRDTGKTFNGKLLEREKKKNKGRKKCSLILRSTRDKKRQKRKSSEQLKSR